MKVYARNASVYKDNNLAQPTEHEAQYTESNDLTKTEGQFLDINKAQLSCSTSL